MKFLIINPGSTSTKISAYEDETLLFVESVFHDAPELLRYPDTNGQVPMRKQVILDMCARHGLAMKDFDIYMGRGGAAYPQRAGVVEINQQLYEDTLHSVGGGEHASKLGVLLAYELCKEYGGQMYTMNPTNVDELCDYARLTGIDGIYRIAQSHVLNQKEVARVHALKIGKTYETANFIVAHIDGGITIHAHKGGKMVDGNVGSGGDGPFTPTRIGSVPVCAVLEYLKSHTIEDLNVLCHRSGGLVSFFGTSNADTVHAMVEAGDKKAQLVWNTMIYQTAKEIGAMAAVLEGKVDGILLTGGLLRFSDISEGIEHYCSWIAPITTYPGELEQEALAAAAYRISQGKEKIHTYTGKPVWNGF